MVAIAGDGKRRMTALGAQLKDAPDDVQSANT